MSKSQELAKNTIILGIGKIFTALVGFLLLPVYTRYLDLQEYGLIDLVIVYATLIVPIITLRLELAVFRWLIDQRGDRQATGATITSILQLVTLSAGVFTLVYFLFNHFVAIPHTALVYSYVILSVVSSILLQIARGMGRTVTFVVGSAMAGFAAAILSILMIIVLDFGFAGALGALAGGFMVSIVYTAAALNLSNYIVRKPQGVSKKELVSFSLPMIPNGAAWWGINALDKVVISKVLGVAANGIYAVSGKFSFLFVGLYEVFNMSWTESAARHINANDRDQFFSSTFNFVLKFFGSCLLLLLAGVPFIFPFFVGNDFKEAYLYIPIILAGVFFGMIVKFIGAIYVAKKMTKQIMNTTIAATLVSLCINLSLIPYIGLWGAAISIFVAYLFVAIHRYIDVQKYVKLTIQSSVLMLLAFFYLIISIAYYQQMMVLDVLGFILALVFAVYINRHEMIYIRQSVLSKLKHNS